MHAYLKGHGWTGTEIAIWLSGLVAAMAGGILVVANILGPWVFVVPGLIATGVGLMRYRAEARARRE